MTQVLTYCTTKIFSFGLLPLVAMSPQNRCADNDDDAFAQLPSVWC